MKKALIISSVVLSAFIVVVFYGMGGCSYVDEELLAPETDFVVDLERLRLAVPHVNLKHADIVSTEGWLEEYQAPPTTGRTCKGDGKASRTTVDTIQFNTFYLVMHRNSKGYWSNPKDGFALTYYDNVTNEPFQWKSYENQMSTDVVSNKVRYPSSIKLQENGTVLRVIHKRNRYETDIETRTKGQSVITPAVIKIDVATGDTICVGHYDCGEFVSGCNWY